MCALLTYWYRYPGERVPLSMIWAQKATLVAGGAGGIGGGLVSGSQVRAALSSHRPVTGLIRLAMGHTWSL